MENYIPFNVNHLKFFFDAASLGSVSKAAKKNYVSQSAISQGIKNLENVLVIPQIPYLGIYSKTICGSMSMCSHD